MSREFIRPKMLISLNFSRLQSTGIRVLLIYLFWAVVLAIIKLRKSIETGLLLSPFFIELGLQV